MGQKTDMKLTRNWTNIWIRSESNRQKSDKNFGRNSDKQPDKKPIILIVSTTRSI